jgi:hypothetical protein
MTDQDDPNAQKRREALNRLRAAHGTPTRPQGLAVDEEAGGAESGTTDARPGARPGEGFRARLAQQGGAGGPGFGGGLRARLAQQGGAGGPGGGPFSRLRARGAQQAAAGGDAPGLAATDAAAGMAQRDPEQARAFLRERIGQLQARLDALDKAAAGTVEDAVVFEEEPAPGKS